MKPKLLSAHSLMSDRVRNTKGEHIGDVKELMIDLGSGCISYGVLSFGGLLGIGDKYFAMPWSMLQIDTENHEIVIDISKETLEDAPGFDKDDWPDGTEWWARVDTHWEAYIVSV